MARDQISITTDPSISSGSDSLGSPSASRRGMGNSDSGMGTSGRLSRKSSLSQMSLGRESTSPGKLGKQSRLAETLSKLRRKGTVGG